MSLTYTRDIPDPPSSPSVDVPNMKINTNSIDTIWTRDHFSFDSSTAGLHNRVQLVEIGTALPVGLNAIGSGTLFTKVSPNPVEGNLFFYRIGALNAIQMTGPGTPVTTLQGSTFLPGGILMQWGLIAGLVAGDNPVVFPIPFPNALFNVSLTSINNSGNVVTVVKSGTTSQTGFTATTSLAPFIPAGIYFTAIGN